MEQTGSWLMSIFRRSGALPEKFTVPRIEPVVAPSAVVPFSAAGWFGLVPLPITAPCRIASFGLHPASPTTTKPVISNTVTGQPKLFILLLSLLCGHRRIHRLHHSVGERLGSGRASNITRQNLAIAIYLLDSGLYTFRSCFFVDVMQHEHGGLQQRGGVCHVLACDVR